jgi:hypothetical protein
MVLAFRGLVVLTLLTSGCAGLFPEAAVEVGVTARQLNDAVAQIIALATSPGWEQDLPQRVSALDLAEAETEVAVDHAFRQSLTLIGVFLGASFATGLLPVGEAESLRTRDTLDQGVNA